MDARFYNTDDIDIEQLAGDLVNVYIAQGYQAQQFGDQQQRLVQLKKGGDFEAIIGMQAALTVTLQKTAGGTLAMIGQQKWLDKAAVGAVGIVALPVLWPLALTAGVGALRQASLSNQVLNMVDGLVRQQRPGLVAGPIPMQLLPQVQQQWGAPSQQQTPVYIPPPQQTPPYIPPPRVVVSEATVAAPPVSPRPAPAPTPRSTQLHCPNCNTPYEAGDTFCSGCGRSLAPAKQYCSNCNFEIKPGASFCPKCGASTFQSGTQQAPAVSNRPLPPPSAPYTPPTPSVAPQPTVTYTQPTTPVYTPPSQPTPPPTPVYTPPPKPATPVYTPPQTPVYTPPPTPQVVETKPAQVTPAPEPPVYVPPTTQNPASVPQPKVTLVPSNEPKKEKPAAPPRPEKQYYIPSSQANAAQAAPTPHGGLHVPPPAPATPIQSRPAAKPASDANASWGVLQFTDGPEIQLKGERAVVGRYDHDLGGIEPEVDLAQIQGADTVSRIHAAIEHIGSTYTLTDLNSTNATRLNGKRLEPDKATSINDGDTLQFGKITCTFKKS